MDPIPRPAVPSDLPAPGRSGAPPASATPDSGSGLLPYLPVPRHRRPTDAELADGGVLASATFIRSTIVFSILFVLAMTTLIWYRWYPVVLPSSSIVFVGDPSIDGAVATVSYNGKEIYAVTIDKRNDYTAIVWVAPGRYDLVVRRDNQVLQRANELVGQMQTLMDPLYTKKPGSPSPTTASATQP